MHALQYWLPIVQARTESLRHPGEAKGECGDRHADAAATGATGGPYVVGPSTPRLLP
jgi:hypothetical protein